MTKKQQEAIENATPEQRLALIKIAMKDVNKSSKNGNLIYRLGDNAENLELHSDNFASTGSLVLDRDIGAFKNVDNTIEFGLMGQKIYEIFGGEGSGKTTVCNQLIASKQKKGGVCAFVDMEQSWDVDYAEVLGVNTEDLLFSQPDNGNEALDVVRNLVSTNMVDLIVVDSVASLVPETDLTRSSNESGVGEQARMMSNFLSRVSPFVNRADTILIFTNQIRTDIAIKYGSKEVTPGGRSLKFYTSVRIKIREGTKIQDSNGDIIGHQVFYKIPKNKINTPHKKGSFDLIYGKGVVEERDLIQIASMYGIIKKRGSWFSYNGESIAQGADGAMQFLLENPEAKAKIKKEVIDMCYKEKTLKEKVEVYNG